jgi:sugar O-acyltransferase (sialic acid O-acetyltransferase NeuD family)
MRRLLIVGAGNFGREVLAWATDIRSSEWEIGGFLDSRSNILDGYDIPLPILGDPLTFEFSAADRVVCALGDPGFKLRYCRDLERRGAAFETLIHPTAIVGPRCVIGAGGVLCPRAILTCDVRIGKFVTLNIVAAAGHDALLGDGCTLSGHALVGGHAKLGEGVFLGSHAVVAPRVKVGDYGRIGAGSAAVRDVPEGVTVFGVPATELFRRELKHLS